MNPKTIAEQARTLGVEVPVLRTAKEIRAMGFTVLSSIPDSAVLCVDDGTGDLRLGPFKERTGYMFVYNKGWREVMLDQAMEAMAKQEDAAFLATFEKVINNR